MASRKSAALVLAGAARALSNQHGFAAAIGSGSVVQQRLHSPSTFSRYGYSSSRSADGPKKILGVFFAAHEYAKNPEFLGCAENALGIREWLESKGHKYVVTSDKDGPNSELDKELVDTHILITTPFHPAYVTKDRLAKAKNLELLVTAGVGSDHIDLHAAAERGLTVSEVTGSNVTSVAEDEVLRILVLLRNFAPAWKQVNAGDWNVAAVVYHAYDLIDRTVGTVGGGRIGQHLMQRLKGFGLKEMLYFDRHALPDAREKELGCSRELDLDTMIAKCDVVVVNTPLTDQTRGLFNRERIAKMRRGAYLVNNARGAIADMEAVREACESGQLGGYGGDVWNDQPAGREHPWRYMKNNAMTAHISGTTLDAQKRFVAGTKDMLDRWFKHEAFPEQNYIVREEVLRLSRWVAAPGKWQPEGVTASCGLAACTNLRPNKGLRVKLLTMHELRNWRSCCGNSFLPGACLDIMQLDYSTPHGNTPSNQHLPEIFPKQSPPLIEYNHLDSP